MASFEQDLIIFEDDRLLLQYTFTDLETNFNSSWGAWWGAWSYDDWTGARTGSTGGEPDLEKITTGWTGTSTVSGSTPTTTGGDIQVVSGDVIVRVFFDQDDFIETTAGTLGTDVEYYTELVVADDATEDRSIVAATGKLFISSSMFSVAGYRP